LTRASSSAVWLNGPYLEIAMPFFYRVGTQEGKSTCKGWSAKREGTTVVVEYGPIQILRSGLRRPAYVWCMTPGWPQRQVYRCRSDQATREKYRELVSRKLRDAESHDGYTRVPSGARIYRRVPLTRPRA
jgi:hypothetical protein